MRTLVVALGAVALAAPARAQTTYPGLVYATLDGHALHMDLRVPNGPGPFPVAVHVHGGAWSSGEYATITPLMTTLIAQGFAVASVQYRLTSQGGQWGSFPLTFPAQIHDVKGAVRWLRANAATYRLDVARFASFGESAGGHLSELLALSAGSSELEGTVGGNLAFSSAVQAAVAYYAPADLLQMNPDVTTPPGSSLDHDAPSSPESVLVGWSSPGRGLADVRAHLSDPTAPYPALVELVRRASPVSWIDASDPPIFLAHGTADTVVASDQSARVAALLAAAGVPYELHAIPNAPHGFGGGAIDALAAEFLVRRLDGTAAAPIGTALCSGDGSASACPCANASFAGARQGCRNSLVVGASLTAFGVPSIASDTLVLHADSMPNAAALYFQGTRAVASGAGATFGDGLRCVGGTITRLATQSISIGSSRYPVGAQPSVSSLGASTAGATLHYQVWYRDPAAFCTAATWNLTNALSVTWQP